MDAPYHNGNDERNLSSGPGNPRAAFWRAYNFAVRQGRRVVGEWLEEYRRIPMFAGLVAEADRSVCDCCGEHIETDVDHGGTCASCRHTYAEAHGSSAA
jgi:hypothetical protein